jgi:hypothetical protein
MFPVLLKVCGKGEVQQYSWIYPNISVFPCISSRMKQLRIFFHKVHILAIPPVCGQVNQDTSEYISWLIADSVGNSFTLNNLQNHDNLAELTATQAKDWNHYIYSKTPI